MIITIYSLDSGASPPEELARRDRAVYVPAELEKELPQTVHREHRLKGIPGCPGKTAPLLIRCLWWLRYLLGITAQPESARQAKQRARCLAEELTEQNKDCVVAAEPAFLELLLRALRRKGLVVRRSNICLVR